MNDVMRYEKQIDMAVNKLTKGLSHEDKQDLKQDCFLALLEASDYMDRILSDGDVAPEAAAYKIAYNKIIDTRGLQGPKILNEAASMDQLNYEEKGDDSFLEGLFSASPTEQGLDAAVESLPKTENFVIRCLYYKGMTERDVAKSVNKSRHWVRVEKEKAVRILRDYFEKR